MIEKYGEKMETTNMQAELQNNLNIIEARLSLALERNDQMERDLFNLMKELQISLKWTSSTKKLSNITSQRNYNKMALKVWTLLLAKPPQQIRMCGRMTI